MHDRFTNVELDSIEIVHGRSFVPTRIDTLSPDVDKSYRRAALGRAIALA